VTDNGPDGTSFQKAKAELFCAPEVDNPFIISDLSAWSDPINDDARCAAVRQRPIQIRSDIHFNFPAHENFAERCFTEDIYIRKLNSSRNVECCRLIYS
jgi:hypothetical protein